MNKTTLKRTAICSALLSAVVMVAGCNDDDNSSSNNSGQQQTTTEKLTGTAATGAALAGANIEVVNKNGTTKSVVAGTDGKFSIDVEKGAPYLLKATKGTGESQITLYSYASAAGNVNVTQLTTQAILAANKADETRDYNSLAEIYTNWAKLAKDSTTDEINTAIDKAAKEVVANLKTVFDASVDTTKGYPNIFKTEFNADSTGLDKVLDQVKINGLNSKCTGIGSTYHCDVQYAVNGQNFAWNYSVDTTGLKLVVDLNSNNNPNIPSGNYNLNVTTSVMGQGATVTVKNVPKPANQNEFCGSDDVTSQLPNGQFKINSCSFNGTVGNINATVNANGFSVTYDVKYEYSPA
ncbi:MULTISPECIES: carboxypeptidase regulatory-like domain-containing protein [unclassified Acinetobacter]|uniref:carboxypeptidase regulatory-like domain-containing protein n=1 Tax=unclassified Acinetobacter TaxID=196816 RepID=UPI002449C027|nr:MULTISPECIES: carboxypeptidase regulatory-like domain-containing protein [unclassified Acinetobacter]MDH0031810.1 carboxypeptidase regulatory-like domain-containing protein [Acinetobacter sp. GD04021]MDH0886125.1 carboxypeptidase regulatory-like domain-containing protein [Acinetobacter sp. GD03873]MDH1082745.1 carboxypeptidase regulatory-like domain-containing protein [Acinetobacter sp. GD03983]MDH2189460.1 carboxypeptidase regulatory-like domain-containing protein [Acinetobacter sp. GD03645